MLLLAPELLAIVLCLGSAKSELGPVDNIGGANIGKLYGDTQASAAA